MRLIDADKFEKELSSVWRWLLDRYNKEYGTTHGEMLDKVHDILIKQPTAYDVDKVVEKLEEARSSVPVNRLLDDIIKDKPKELGMLIAYDDAIEIVKAGGKNER